ncbi:major facilitator superfamily domain-containing protein [Abortiporus biennis]|nr:major facilitator superfamily domain-containing protein [Abortiporus biennis]
MDTEYPPISSRTVESTRSSKLRLILLCASITANALCAGGVYSFPLISPALVKHMKLTQPQLTTIALAGMVGQYPFAAFVGKLLDRYGPRMCSLLAAILFSLGLGLFSLEVANTPDTISAPSSACFQRLSLYFGMAGLATVLSYFSIVFSSTTTFPKYMGIASGTSMALFGFSPLLLSVLASKFFTSPDPEEGLNVTNFLAFLAILSGFVHVFGAIVMNGRPRHLSTDSSSSTPEDRPVSPTSSCSDFEGDHEGRGPSSDLDPERQGLLIHRSPRKPPHEMTFHVVLQEPQHGSVADLLQDPHFWLLALVMALIVGSAEMVMANLGSIFLSLPSSSSSNSSPPSLIDVSTQVQVLSASNTLSRLLIGPVADFLSPVAAYLQNGIWSFPRKQHISRMVFLTGAAMLLAMTFFWSEVGIKTREGMWVMSVGVGVAYGATFTVCPGILSSIWGLPNLGRNFGIISYAPFVGTTLFSYLYAFVAEHQTAPNENACEGVKCWRTTFWISVLLMGTGMACSGVLWKRWKGRV